MIDHQTDKILFYKKSLLVKVFIKELVLYIYIYILANNIIS